MAPSPSTAIETFQNPAPDRAFTIRMRLPEFTCLCPRTGQPVPDSLCIELKALKNYIWSFRDQGAFHEAVTNRILDDLVAAAAPRFLRLTAEFNVRGGIYTTVIAEHRQAGWAPPAAVTLPAGPPP
jgi:7-cyano-7-deazaguanine reductase